MVARCGIYLDGIDEIKKLKDPDIKFQDGYNPRIEFDIRELHIDVNYNGDIILYIERVEGRVPIDITMSRSIVNEFIGLLREAIPDQTHWSLRP